MRYLDKHSADLKIQRLCGIVPVCEVSDEPEERGAEILEGSVILGDNAYDAVPGFVGAPIGSFADHRKHTPPSASLSKSITTDEDLLAELLKAKL